MTRSPETSHTPSVRLVVGLVALVLLSAGCGGSGNGQGLDENGNLLGQPGAAPGGGAGGGSVGASGNQFATLAWVQANVFASSAPSACHTCHSGPSAPHGVDWTAAKICNNVGRASEEMATTSSKLNEIENGNADASYMIWKVQGAGPNGAALAPNSGQMPLGGPFLLPDAIQNLRDWINDGVPGCP